MARRDKQLYADYCAHLNNGLTTMEAYAACAHTYDLDPDYLRRIIRKQACSPGR